MSDEGQPTIEAGPDLTTTTPPAGIFVDYDSLPTEIRDTGTIKKFTKDGKIDIANALKSHVFLEKKLGNAINLPGESATDEEKSEFRKRMGVPDSPDGYKLNIQPVGNAVVDEALTKSFTKLAHEMGLNPVQAQKGVEWFTQEITGKMIANNEASIAKAADDLKAAWGDDYPKRMELAKRALVDLADPADRDAVLNDPSLGNNPILIKIFDNVAKRTSEGRFIKGSDITETPDDISRRIDEIASDPRYNDPMSPMYERLHREKDNLFKKLYPPK
jgi:hypothetical protein